MYVPTPPLGGRGAGFSALFAYRANGQTPATVLATPVHAARVEVHAPRAARVVRVERIRPIVAVVAGIQPIFPSVARLRKKDEVAIGPFYYVTIFAVTIFVLVATYRPSPFAVLAQFRPFVIGRHTPSATPVGTGGIVGEFEFGFVIYGTIISICVILGKRFKYIVPALLSANCPLVVCPIIIIVARFNLAPLVALAILLGFGGTYVASSPFGAAWLTKVNIVVAIGGTRNTIIKYSRIGGITCYGNGACGVGIAIVPFLEHKT